ncbi:MAG: hypothetical protein Kow0047_29660 [Anaerolineae bacterium]
MALVTAIVLGAAVLRWFLIGAKPLWLDESFSYWMARQPLEDVWGWLVRIDQHPPLYYLVLHGWIGVLGDSEVALRSLSAVCSLLAVPIVYRLGRAIGGARVGILTAALVATSPLQIQYAQETRMYGLLTLFTALAMWGLAVMVRRSGRGSDPQGWDLLKPWAAYVIGTAGALLTHNTAVLFWAATWLAGWPYWSQGVRNRRVRRSWLTAQAAILAIWAIWLPSFVRQSLMVYREFWIQPPTLGTIVWTFQGFYSAFVGDAFPLRPLVDLWVWPWLILGLLRWRHDRRWPVYLASLWLVAPLGELVVSIWRPIFYLRTLMWVSVPVLLIVAVGVDAVRSAKWRRVVLAGLLLIHLGGAANYYFFFEKEAWDEAAAYVAERVQPRDLLLFNATWVQIPFDYYFRRYDVEAVEHGVPVDLFDAGVLEPKMTWEDVPRLESLVAERRRIWLIYSHNWYTDPEGIIPAVLGREARLQEIQRFRGLAVYFYER